MLRGLTAVMLSASMELANLAAIQEVSLILTGYMLQGLTNFFTSVTKALKHWKGGLAMYITAANDREGRDLGGFPDGFQPVEMVLNSPEGITKTIMIVNVYIHPNVKTRTELAAKLTKLIMRLRRERDDIKLIVQVTLICGSWVHASRMKSWRHKNQTGAYLTKQNQSGIKNIKEVNCSLVT
ncbi:hypothetical protein NDU88_002210 [Pleurodeles waltl]|uniref:Uncharacterized protein n=1 Tax=Pleurodeles waltl TaxID=8319 RepID=A0AAV7M5B6_PLEWA|nr:hypothetical protein NDU88_002210 [Pleurodeles waltl]